MKSASQPVCQPLYQTINHPAKLQLYFICCSGQATYFWTIQILQTFNLTDLRVTSLVPLSRNPPRSLILLNLFTFLLAVFVAHFDGNFTLQYIWYLNKATSTLLICINLSHSRNRQGRHIPPYRKPNILTRPYWLGRSIPQLQTYNIFRHDLTVIL